MADTLDIAAVAPDLELTIQPTSLRCTGTLSGRTLPYLLEAVASLLAARPPVLIVDMSRVYVADVDGANTFAHLQRMAKDAEVELRWIGLEPDRLRGLHPLRSPAQRTLSGPTRLVPGRAGSRDRQATLPPIA